jgi:alanine racemase
MVDLGRAGPPVSTGDDVLLFGEIPAGEISGSAKKAAVPASPGDAALMAEKLETIPYEITCGITKRVPRIYLN